MPAPTQILVQDLYPGIRDLLMGRAIDEPRMAEAIRKSVLEFAEDYWFEGLQTKGPVVQLVARQSKYGPQYFMNPLATPVLITKVQSFFIYSGPYVDPSDPNFQETNAGYDLTFRSIDRLEVLLNTPGIPIHWSRHGGFIWVAGAPDKDYYIFMRYQTQHPFPNANGPAAGTDIILFSYSWQEIVELAAAQRLAQTYNLSSKASEFNTRLRGSSQFQQSGGISGSPGLIFKRTSELERDQTTSVKRFRLRMGRQ